MNPRLFSSIERLEDRIAPAGLVTLTYTSGHLALDGGDAGDHSLSLAFADGSLVVRGLAGTSLAFDGKTATDAVTIAGFSGSVKATLGDGNDTVQFGPGAFPGDVALDLGGGDNRVIAGNLSIAGSLGITGAAGADRVVFGGTRTVVGGDVKLDLGGGANAVASGLGAFAVGGKLSVKTGGGNDSLVFGGSDYLIGGDTMVTTGAGSDVVAFVATNIGIFGGKLGVSGTSAAGEGEKFSFGGEKQVVFRGAIAIQLGAGDGAVALHSGGKLHAQSDLSIDTGHGADTASVTAKDVSLDGDVAVKSAGGVDLKIAASHELKVAGNVNVAGGPGTDHVAITGGGEIDGTVKVDVGTGAAQSITLAGTAAQSLVLKSAVSLVQGAATGTSLTQLISATFLSSLNFASSSADDTIKIADVTFDGPASFSTGSGIDVFVKTPALTPAPVNPLSGLTGSGSALAAIVTASLAADHLALTSGSVLAATDTTDLATIGVSTNLERYVVAPLSVETAR